MVKRNLNTRDIVIYENKAERISNMFHNVPFSHQWAYEKEIRSKEILTKLLNDIGIVQIAKKGDWNIEELFFEQPTLIFYPYINNIQNTTAMKSMGELIHRKFNLISGWNVLMKNNKIYRPLDNDIKRVMVNNIAIADYYPQRNLLIVNFRLIPPKPRFSILKAACDFLKESLEQNNINIANTVNPEEIEAVNKERNVKLFIQSVKKRRAEIEENVQFCNRDAILKNKAIIDLYKRAQLGNVELEALKNFEKNFSENFDTKLKEVEELTFVKNVKLNSSGILVEIGNLTLCDKSKLNKAYIGYMSFLITPNQIQILNRYSMKNLQHPHVSDQNPCFGTHREGVNKLLGNMDLKRLVFALYQFLHTYTPNSAFRDSKIYNWKVFRKQEKRFDIDGNMIGQGKKVVTDKVQKLATTTIAGAITNTGDLEQQDMSRDLGDVFENMENRRRMTERILQGGENE